MSDESKPPAEPDIDLRTCDILWIRSTRLREGDSCFQAIIRNKETKSLELVLRWNSKKGVKVYKAVPKEIDDHDPLNSLKIAVGKTLADMVKSGAVVVADKEFDIEPYSTHEQLLEQLMKTGLFHVNDIPKF